MDEDGLNGFIQTLLTLFMNDEFGEAGEHVAFPLVVYTAVGVAVLHDPEQLMTMFQQYRQAFASLGIVRTTFEIEERDTTKNERTRVLVRFINQMRDGTTAPGSRVRYFLVRSGHAYKVEMMEFVESSLPDSDVDRIIH